MCAKCTSACDARGNDAGGGLLERMTIGADSTRNVDRGTRRSIVCRSDLDAGGRTDVSAGAPTATEARVGLARSGDTGIGRLELGRCLVLNWDRMGDELGEQCWMSASLAGSAIESEPNSMTSWTVDVLGLRTGVLAERTR
jgi:hypothetical protein